MICQVYVLTFCKEPFGRLQDVFFHVLSLIYPYLIAMATLTCLLLYVCYRVTPWLWAKWGKATEELRRMGDRQFQRTERAFLRTPKVPQVLKALPVILELS